MGKTPILSLAAAAMLNAGTTFAAGKLVVSDAWIRTPPPNMSMLAGYATLRNAGDKPLTILGASSPAFGAASLHQTVSADGIERMRPLGTVRLVPGASVTLAPGGKHLMLMQPKHALAAGDKVTVHFNIGGSPGADAEFAVRDAAPDAH